MCTQVSNLLGFSFLQRPHLFAAASTRNPVTHLASMLSASDIPGESEAPTFLLTFLLPHFGRFRSLSGMAVLRFSVVLLLLRSSRHTQGHPISSWLGQSGFSRDKPVRQRLLSGDSCVSAVVSCGGCQQGTMTRRPRQVSFVSPSVSLCDFVPQTPARPAPRSTNIYA